MHYTKDKFGHVGKVPGDEIEFIPLPEKPGVNSIDKAAPL